MAEPAGPRAMGLCRGCGRLKRLRTDGTVPEHAVAIAVSRRAVPTVGAGSVKARCSGSGQGPRKGATP
jgi:hypothetical protein